ncbi:glutamyl-tRNA amidotransferase subunit C [Lactobacillus johnsonii N6.2]|uniref:Aspartyl/glutamyl-tRNA(Asn/Gln) amidotransferase subunit C n=1 Tax=Lactobacillus johnsonii N6.2 TaxID=1408186 RepID=A0A7D9N800_LACJH|nr:Asp-tRNA(Asn)/Glu-tRNA(Gln) amidotransferase subunit GatC [Lactobacillus johnsonii]AHA97809.1 glutamyl-tRNA amidotransferase subunit C [Lactobacillus johnsonii N6.2]
MSTSLAVNRRQTVKITKDEINHVAALSRLEFGEDEIDKFTEQMGDIINMAHQLAEVDTEGVPETVQVVDRETDFREDKPEHWESRAELMKNVPEKADGFIKVPVIIDKDDNE